MYNTDIPDVIIINNNATAISQASIIAECESCGQPYSRLPAIVYDKVAIWTIGYTAQEAMREFWYNILIIIHPFLLQVFLFII